MQGVLVLIEKINWRSKEGSDYVSWLICRLIVVINQRAEVMFLLFILSSNVVLLTRFDLCLQESSSFARIVFARYIRKSIVMLNIVINILVSIFNSLLIIVEGPQSSHASIWSPYRILFYMRSCYYRR